MTQEELLSVAAIVERLVKRFEEQGAEYERKMAEHRDSFGARTEADRKIIEGLRADLAKEREEHQEDVGHLNGEIVRFHGIADDLCNRLNSLGIKAAKQAGEALGMVEGEGLLCAAKRVVKERDGLLTQVQDQRAEIERLRNDERKAYQDGEALRAEVADLRGIVDMVHADLGIQRGDHVGEAISELKKEASDATARQRMTEARALNYSLQAEEARREIERLRAKLASRTVEWPEWAKVGQRVRVRSVGGMYTSGNFDKGDEFNIAVVDRRDWTVNTAINDRNSWAHVSDLEPVAEHVTPAVVSEQPIATQTRTQETAPVLPRVGDTVRLVKRPEMYGGEDRWSDVWGIVGQEGKMTENVHNIFLSEPYILVSTQGKGESVHRLREWPVSCIEVVK